MLLFQQILASLAFVAGSSSASFISVAAAAVADAA